MERIIFETIVNHIRTIQNQNGNSDGVVEAKYNLVQDLGFKSLDIAQLIAMLEMEWGYDPFAQGATLANMHTVEDLCMIYMRNKEGLDE